MALDYATDSLPKSGVPDMEAHSSHRRMTNKQLADFARTLNLPPPMFLWNPRFNELPNETLDLVASFLDSNVIAKRRRSPYTITEEPEAVRPNISHPLNTLALVSKRLNDIIEKHCELLLKKHDQHVTVKGRSIDRITNRGSWLAFISNKCIFCLKTSQEVAAKVAANKSPHLEGTSLFEEYCRVRDTVDEARMLCLTGTPFNHGILCCGFCEVEDTGKIILLEHAVQRYKIPPYFFHFPPIPIRVGRRDRRYGLSTTTRLLFETSSDDFGFGSLSVRESSAIYLIEDEVKKVRDEIVANPSRVVPSWMAEMPGCIEEAKSGGQLAQLAAD